MGITLNQLTNTVSKVMAKIKDKYVPKENDKGLSTNDYTNEDKNKVAKIDTIENSVKEVSSQIDEKANVEHLEINILDYIALGMSDDEAFQTACADALKNSNTVYNIKVPPKVGGYQIKNSIFLSKSMNLIGMGGFLNTIKMLTPNKPLIITDGGSVENFTLEHISNDYENDILISIGKEVKNVKTTIKNILIKKCKYGIHSIVECDTTEISDCQNYENVTGAVIYLNNISEPSTTGLQIKRCHFSDSVVRWEKDYQNYGIYLGRCSSATLENNIINGYAVNYFGENLFKCNFNCCFSEVKPSIDTNYPITYSENLEVVEGQYIYPMAINSTGYVYKVVNSGTLVSDTGWGTTIGTTFANGTATLIPVYLSCNFYFIEANFVEMNNCTTISAVDGIRVNRADFLTINNLYNSDVANHFAFRNISTSSKFTCVINSSKMRGNIKICCNNQHKYLITKTFCLDNNYYDTNNRILDNANEDYAFNFDYAYKPSKTVNEDYEATFEEKYLFVDTTNANITIRCLLTNFTQYMKPITIIKNSSDENIVNIRTDGNNISGITLTKKGDNCTLYNYGYPYYFIIDKLVKLS